MDCKEKCGDEYSGKACKCYATYGTTSPLTDQFCAWRDGNFLFACDPSCCKDGKGCPGECSGSKPANPAKFASIKPTVVKKEDMTIRTIDIKELLLIVLVYLFFLRIIYT